MGWFSKLLGGNDDAGGAQSCISCDSKDVAEIAPSAYRCNMCGYEGGDGYAAFQSQQQISRLANRSEDELRVRALDELEQCRLMLVGVGGQVDTSVLGRAASVGSGIEIAAGVTLRIAAGGMGGIGGGAIGRAEAEERERLVQQRRMDLIEACGTARKLQLTLRAWASKPHHDVAVDEAQPIADALLVDENAPDQRIHELQVLVERARVLLDPVAFMSRAGEDTTTDIG